MSVQKPTLFGLKHSNRDFSQKDSWGKNKFNSAFPASLCCYMESRKIKANYLSITNGEFVCGFIPISELLGRDPLDDNTFFAFESAHSPFQKYVVGPIPRTDLVVQERNTGRCISGIEIKLTALPDNSTCEMDEKDFGAEIVVRPDTIVYLACSLAETTLKFKNFVPDLEINDWSEPKEVLKNIEVILSSIKKLAIAAENTQVPLLIQPIWKTMGKSPELSENCLDIFSWSNAAFAHFIASLADSNTSATTINRQTRTAIWLFKMLYEIKTNGQFDHEKIINTQAYNNKNDKAFAASGLMTSRFIKSSRIIKPIITKSEIKNIIIGGGQNLLSPERRFDAIIFSSPNLFDL